MTTTAPRREFKVVGTRPIRHDGLEKVTGAAKYGADVHLPGMLQAKILRSPHAHARIKNIDTSKAEALDGVRAVVTAKDFPDVGSGSIDLGEMTYEKENLGGNVMARGKALYKGHAIAAVAAISPHIAEQALDLIAVDYEVLTPVLSVEEAMDEKAPLVHESQTTKELGQDTGVRSNIASHMQFKRGDLEQGFKDADVIVEREYRTRSVHQGYIEPHTATVNWAQDGHVTVWTSTQWTFGVRAQVAGLLGVPESQVKVVPMEIGGGFGGKISVYFEPVAGLLSKKTGCPVKITMSRKEVFEGTGPTSAAKMKCKIGAKKDGTMTAAHLWMAFEAGAYPGSPVGAAAMTGLSPYRLDHLVIDAYDVVVNKQKVAAYRAPGAPQAAYAVETCVDELAERLGMDPMDVRMKNASREGDRQVTGVPFSRIGCIEVAEAIKASEHYNAPLQGPNTGRGVAMGFWFNVGMQSSANINVNADGTVSLVTGSVDIGGTRVAVAMQAAEVLGIAAEDVIPTVGDTDSVGWTSVTGGSRTAMSTGMAAYNAANEAVRRMSERAAVIWETQPDDVDFADGLFSSKKNPDERLTFKELAAKLPSTGGLINASAHSHPTQVGPSFAGLIVDVRVDPETGKVDVLRTTAVQDVGQAGHPSYVEGQMQGGAAQGIGWALNEEYFFDDDGSMLNSSYLDYRMPTSLDLPDIETILVQVPNPGHPFGLRGVGEVPIVPPMAAVTNAIHQAIGVRMTRLPMNPASIVEAVQGKQG